MKRAQAMPPAASETEILPSFLSRLELQTKLMKVEEFAEVIGVSKTLVYKWINHEDFPHIKLGDTQIDPVQAVRWLRKRQLGDTGKGKAAKGRDKATK